MSSKLQNNTSTRALNWLNFFAADVSSGVGPFLAVYLAGNLHWTPGKTGLAMSVMSLATVVFQSPAGYLTDRMADQRMPVILASVVMGLMGLGIPLVPVPGFILTAQALMGIAAACYAPALVALAATLASNQGFDRTIGQNQTYNHAGNVVSAVMIGIIGRYTHNEGIFYTLLALAACCVISALAIQRRGMEQPPVVLPPVQPQRPALAAMFRHRPFAIFLLAALVFHFANAAMLPLVGQQISQGKHNDAALYMSACIVIAQLVMVPVTYATGIRVQRGRKTLLLVAFAVLPLRGVLYTLCHNEAYLIFIQLLDGIAAGIFGVVSILVVEDLMGHTGKRGFAQGLLATAVGLGASLSNLVTGYLVDAAGFNAGFLALSVLALAALVLLWVAMPETLLVYKDGLTAG